jgi:hypothetical protein
LAERTTFPGQMQISRRPSPAGKKLFKLINEVKLS